MSLTISCSCTTSMFICCFAFLASLHYLVTTYLQYYAFPPKTFPKTVPPQKLFDSNAGYDDSLAIPVLRHTACANRNDLPGVHHETRQFRGISPGWLDLHRNPTKLRACILSTVDSTHLEGLLNRLSQHIDNMRHTACVHP